MLPPLVPSLHGCAGRELELQKGSQILFIPDHRWTRRSPGFRSEHIWTHWLGDSDTSCSHPPYFSHQENGDPGPPLVRLSHPATGASSERRRERVFARQQAGLQEGGGHLTSRGGWAGVWTGIKQPPTSHSFLSKAGRRQAVR